MIPVILYILLCIVYSVLGISSASAGTLTIHLSFFVLILLLISCTKFIISPPIYVLWAILLVIAFNVMDNIRICIQHPGIYYLVSRGAEDVGASYNLGSSKFYNGVFFYYTICLFGFLNCKEKRWKYILLGCAFLSLLFLLGFCVKASVIAYAILSTFLLLHAQKSKSIQSFSFRVLIPSLLVFTVINLFSDTIIELLIKHVPSERLVSRLVVFVDSESEEASRGVSTFTARQNLWLLSIQTWTDNIINFVIGIGDHRANYKAGGSAWDTGIGQHSDLIDSLARYGLLGLFLLGTIFKKGFKLIDSFYGRYYKVQLFVIYIIFILFGCTKGVFQPDIGFVMFILLPMLSTILTTRDIHNRKKNI